MSNGPVFTVRSYTSLPYKKPLDVCSFNPFVTATTVTQARPNGMTGASIGMAELATAGTEGRNRGGTTLPRPVYAVSEGHVEVYAGLTLLSEGRLVEANFAGGMTSSLRIEGYSLQGTIDAAWYPAFAASDMSYYTAGRLLLQALADTSPLVPPPATAQFSDTGVLHRYSEVAGKTVAQLAQQFGTEGNGAALFDFMMWGERRVQFLPRIAPYLVQYREDVDDGVATQRTDGDLCGTVYVRYTDAITGASNQLAGPFVDPTFATRNSGLMRTKEVNGGTLSAAGALAFGRTYLAKYSQPTYRITITRNGQRGMRLPPGGMRAPWFVRCDEWVRLGDLPALPIVRCDVNLTSGQSAFQLGDPPQNGVEMIRGLQTVARAVQRGISPVSYATR